MKKKLLEIKHFGNSSHKIAHSVSYPLDAISLTPHWPKYKYKYKDTHKYKYKYRVFFNTGPPLKISKYRTVNLG